MKRGLGSIILRELSWLSYVTPIFADGLVKQWKKRISGNVKYDSLEDVVDFACDEHSVDKVNLVGHSLGAMLAMSYTLSNPDRVSTCMTVAAPFGGTNKAVLGLVQFGLGIYASSIFQLLPCDRYIRGMKRKIKKNLPEFEHSYDLRFINIWSPVDEFVSRKETSLDALIGRRLSNVEEHKVYLGHCSAFYCDTTLDILNDLVQDSSYPTILLHGFTLNEHFFDIFIDSLDDSLENKVYAISYDYAKRLKL
jgi:hypothetical protein